MNIFFRCMFLAIELPHVLELDFSSIKDRFIVLQCGLSGTIVFSNCPDKNYSAALELFKLSNIDYSVQIFFFCICEWNATG